MGWSHRLSVLQPVLAPTLLKVSKSDHSKEIENFTDNIAAINVVDVYLDEKLEAERNHIRQLAGSNDPNSTELLRGYVREAMR